MGRLLREHRFVTIVFFASTVVTAGGWIWAYLALRHITTPIILRFVGGVGIMEIGSLSDIHMIGTLGVCILLANAAVAFGLDTRDPYIGKFVAGATMCLATLLFIALAAIISVN